MNKKQELKYRLEYTEKLNKILAKQSDALAEALRFYADSEHASQDGGTLARKTLKEWYDL